MGISRERRASCARLDRRKRLSYLALAFIALGALAGAADTVDRIAVVVGKTVITESEVMDALRVTAFLNGEPLDFSPAKRRAAAERLVDQELLRKEMQATRFAMPPANEVEGAFERYARQQASFPKYGITGDELKRQLGWQLAVMRFTELRFRNDFAAPAAGAPNGSSADRQAATAADSVDQRMEEWLKDARNNTKVVFQPEAFQ
jgi:hypothetical protein